jgi:4'-phosphopantetheinyl transferase
VEETKPRARLDRLADACLAPCEKSRWLAAPAEHRPGEFTRHWVGKEAWVKATGRGISAGLRHVVVAPDYSSYLSVPTGYGPAEAWHLREWAHRNRWVAVAWGGAKRRLRLLE